MNPNQARRTVKGHIKRNPTSIEIQRIQETDDGAGGVIKTTITLPAQIARVFMTETNAIDATNEGGIVQSHRWSLLAEHDADVKRGDTFQHLGMTFRVQDVNPASTGGEVVALHAALNEVS